MKINIGSKEHFLFVICHATSMLGQPAQYLKDEYADCPICLMEYREKGVTENIIEVRFDIEFITVSYVFDANDINTHSYLFFDEYEHESLFINHLVRFFEYDYRRGFWNINGCRLKAKESEGQVAWEFCIDPCESS